MKTNGWISCRTFWATDYRFPADISLRLESGIRFRVCFDDQLYNLDYPVPRGSMDIFLPGHQNWTRIFRRQLPPTIRHEFVFGFYDNQGHVDFGETIDLFASSGRMNSQGIENQYRGSDGVQEMNSGTACCPMDC